MWVKKWLKCFACVRQIISFLLTIDSYFASHFQRKESSKRAFPATYWLSPPFQSWALKASRLTSHEQEVKAKHQISIVNDAMRGKSTKKMYLCQRWEEITSIDSPVGHRGAESRKGFCRGRDPGRERKKCSYIKWQLRNGERKEQCGGRGWETLLADTKRNPCYSPICLPLYHGSFHLLPVDVINTAWINSIAL